MTLKPASDTVSSALMGDWQPTRAWGKKKNPLQSASPVNLKAELWQPDKREQSCSHLPDLACPSPPWHGQAGGGTKPVGTAVGRWNKVLGVGKTAGRMAGHQESSAQCIGAKRMVICLCAGFSCFQGMWEKNCILLVTASDVKTSSEGSTRRSLYPWQSSSKHC